MQLRSVSYFCSFELNVIKQPVKSLIIRHVLRRLIWLSNSYTMGCPPVRGDNPRAFASGLSYVQVDEHGITIFSTYISVDLAHHDIFCAKVGKGGIRICLGMCLPIYNW